MTKNGALFSVCFVAGLLAEIGHSLFLWGCSEWGVTTFIGVKISPTLTLAWLYPRMIVGGLWGLGYFLTISVPRYRRHWIRKGLWFSLIPAATTLFYLLPYQQQQGMLGFDLGMLTPLYLVIAYMVWGSLTGFFTRLLWGR